MKTVLTSFCVALLSFTGSDIHKEMVVKDEAVIHDYSLVFFSPSGSASFSGTSNKELIHFIGDYDEEQLELDCSKKTKGSKVNIDFNLQEKSEGFADVFSSSDKAYINDWSVYLKRDKVVELDLFFGHGEAYLNLSSLSVKKLKLENVDAAVRLNYSIGQPNKVRMDTLLVSAELGDITFDGLELSNAKHVTIDNSYGNTTLNIQGRPKDRLVADVYVGTGKVLVKLPKTEIPIKVVMKEKHLASLSLPQNFVQTSERIYVNKAYQESKVDPIVFHLHGSLGEVIFQMKP